MCVRSKCHTWLIARTLLNPRRLASCLWLIVYQGRITTVAIQPATVNGPIQWPELAQIRQIRRFMYLLFHKLAPLAPLCQLAGPVKISQLNYIQIHILSLLYCENTPPPFSNDLTLSVFLYPLCRESRIAKLNFTLRTQNVSVCNSLFSKYLSLPAILKSVCTSHRRPISPRNSV